MTIQNKSKNNDDIDQNDNNYDNIAIMIARTTTVTMKTISILMTTAMIINENKDDNDDSNKDNVDGNDDCHDENISPNRDNNNDNNDDNRIGSNGSNGEDNNDNRIKINDDNKNVTVLPVTIMMVVTMNIINETTSITEVIAKELTITTMTIVAIVTMKAVQIMMVSPSENFTIRFLLGSANCMWLTIVSTLHASSVL